MNEKINALMLGCIIGDALGASLDGMSRGHINSNFKGIKAYIDPTPALKGRMGSWKKPGLYTTVSQMMIILAMASLKRRLNYDNFIRYTLLGAEKGGSEYGIFRAPGIIERNFINRIKNQNVGIYPSLICTRVVPILLPILFHRNCSYERLMYDIIIGLKLFTSDMLTIAGTVIFLSFINSVIDNDFGRKDIISDLIEKAEGLQGMVRDNPPAIFNLKTNPDSLLNDIDLYKDILIKIKNVSCKNDGEKEIYTFANRIFKTPIKRATVNHPLVLIPYSILLARISYDKPHNALYIAAGEGGATTPLCMLTGIIMSSIYGIDWIPESLIKDLVNKNRITNITEMISRRKVSEMDILDFIDAENSLTQKEFEERNARLKHHKTGIKQKKTRVNQERDLSRHVVESWTKIDKAKWKKSKKKTDFNFKNS